MSYAAIVNKQVAGSPEDVRDTSGNGMRHTYRGTSSDLTTNRPAVGDDWNGLEVVSTSLRQIGMSLRYELVVEARISGSGVVSIGSTAITNNEFPLLELDNMEVEKSLRQHPAFASFVETDFQAIDLWIAETDSEQRKLFKYWKRDANGNTTGTVQTLSTTLAPDNSQQDFAALYLLGVEAFSDHAPIARKTSLFKGTTAPTTTDIGQKIVGDPFTGVPSGYTWVKKADRATKQGRGFFWTRVEEWIGAREVLLDKDEIFI